MNLIEAPRLVLAGINSGCGKTTLAAGVLAALRRRGLKAQGFKVGPDYIDPGFHTLAAGRASRNLDSWMVSPEALRELFQHGSATADINIIEGVMGLFDGHSGSDDSGSTAEVARVLQAPVVLVLDISKTSRTAAAMVLGCRHFDPGLDIRGVILNRAGSARHWQWVKEAIEQKTDLPVLGHLPRDAGLQLPERHLGLVPANEHDKLEDFIEKLAPQIEVSVDIEALLKIAGRAPPLTEKTNRLFPEVPVEPKIARIAIARDEAFSFYYQDNLDLLEAHGAELIPFSPLRDTVLPPGTRGLYLGGGFPEVFAARLAKNQSMLKAVKLAGLSGMPVYAECGGLMYLAEGVADRDGARHPMVGLVPGWSSMKEMRLKLAYVEIAAHGQNPLLNQGTTIRGHEFHYSQLPPPLAEAAAWQVRNPEPRLEGFHLKNILASYIHLHFATHPCLAPAFVKWMRFD